MMGSLYSFILNRIKIKMKHIQYSIFKNGYVCGFVFVNTGAYGDLEFKVVVTCLPWMLGINLDVLLKTAPCLFMCLLRQCLTGDLD